MKIRILTDAHHRISSGRSQSFKAGREINVPKATAEKLIADGKAEAVKPSTKGD
jgi:uncharacterized protein YabE (DUF348 family)